MANWDYQAACEMQEYLKNRVLAKFPLLGTTLANLELVPTDEVFSGATDGKHLFWSPTKFARVDEMARLWTFAHECLHVAFDHLRRRKGHEPELWNQATDAVVNQILLENGLPFPKPIPKLDADGHNVYDAQGNQVFLEDIRHPEAHGKSAEEMYAIMLKEPQEKTNPPVTNHQNWGQAASPDKKHHFQPPAAQPESLPETAFTQLNTQLRNDLAQKVLRNLRQNKDAKAAKSSAVRSVNFRDLGTTAAVAPWQKLLRRELLKQTEMWSYRRADADNDYAARLELLDLPEDMTTEVMIDISGSVDDEFVRAFVRQLQPLLRAGSQLKVGFFADEASPLVPLKNSADIAQLRLPKVGKGTNLDAAVRAFSRGQKKSLNKLVFTDGVVNSVLNLPHADLRDEKVWWLVYGDADFAPCCGQVIRVDAQALTQEQTNTHEKSY